MDDAGVVGLVDAYEHSVEAGVAVATREPQLIRERTSLGETALHLLVLGRSLRAIESLLSLGAEVDVVCCVGDSPLSLAASQGQVEIVRILLGSRAKLMAEGQLEPTLHKAVRSGSVDVVRLLLDAGAEIDEQAEFGEAPIHIAADEGHAAVLEVLLERGANTRLVSSFGGTALEMAQAAGQEACVALLAQRH